MNILSQILLATSALATTALAGPLPHFGATTKAPSPALSAQQQLADDTGFVITKVTPNTPAATLGLQKNDLVLTINGKTPRNIISLNEYVASALEADQEVTVKWQRNGAEQVATTKLTSSLERKQFASLYQNGMGSGQDIAKEIEQQLAKQLGGSGFSSSFGSGSFQSKTLTIGGNSRTMSDGTHKITVTKADNGLSHVKVVLKDDGSVLFEGDVSPEDLSTVPEDVREKVKGLLSNNMLGGTIDLNMLIEQAAPNRGNAPAEKKPEESINDLLEGLEKTEKPDAQDATGK